MGGLKVWLAGLNRVQKAVLGAGVLFVVVMAAITASLISGPIAGRLSGEDRAVYTGPTVAEPPAGTVAPSAVDQGGSGAPPVEGGSDVATAAGSLTGPPDVYVATVRVTGSGASTQATSTAATSSAGGGPPAGVSEFRVGAVSSVEVHVQVGNGGGPAALDSNLEITLFTPGAPQGVRVVRSVAQLKGGESADFDATFDQLAAYAGGRLTLRVALLPGDGGRPDRTQASVLLAE
jgi:hypothetical protein